MKNKIYIMKIKSLSLFLFISILLNMFAVCLYSNDLNRQSSSYINRYALSCITMQDGLPNVFVDDILKDSKGYIWVSTMGGGISRYDGHEFVNFSTNSSEHKLKSNFVSYLCEDNHGRIWAAGENGIDIISVETLDILTDKIDVTYDKSLLDLPVNCMIIAKSGNLWVSSKGILYKYIIGKDGNISDVIKISEISINERGTALCEIDGHIWFQKRDMICRVSENVTSWQEPQAVSSSLISLYGQSVFCIYCLNNEVWIGSNFGIMRYNIMTDTVRHYYYNRDDINSLSQNYVTDITATRDGVIIIGTLMGINIYNSSSDNFEHIVHDEDDAMSVFELNSNFVNVLYSDVDNNIIWIGTESGGLTKMYPSRLFVSNYYHLKNQKTSLSKNLVNAIVEDDDNTLWVGVVEGGLNCKTSNSDGFIHYNMDAPAYLSHNTISALALDNDERLYIGTWGGGVGWINRKNGKNKRFNKIGIKDPFISTILCDSINSLVWIGTQNGFYVYNPNNDQVLEPFKDIVKEVVNIYALGGCITKDNNLWLSSAYGLLRIDLKSYHDGKLEYRKYLDNDSHADKNRIERVTSIYEAKNGVIWIGSNGSGIYKAVKKDKDEYEFTSYTVSDGLINNNVRGILEDWYGNIWITTINGLSKYNPKDSTFTSYTSKDGLVSDHFYWNAASVSDNGERIYLGSVGGLSVVHPVIEKENIISYPLVINKITVFDNICHSVNNTLELHERDKSLSIEFAALDYNPSSLASYSYRLIGFDDKWNNVSTDRRVVTYTNLKPGKYKFQLKYTSDGKNWISVKDDLVIEVTPYYYKTPWFILTLALVIAFIVYRIALWRFHEMKRQQIVLHEKVEERTKELKEQQKILSKQTMELYNQNELLKTRNAQILEQKNKILEMSRKVEELTIDKLTFFTNITHEFRTPLTLIVGPIERALKLSYNPQVIEQLNLVEKNSKYLLSLVNQLLDFRKVEDGRMKIINHHGNIKTFLDGLLKPFDAFAYERGIILNEFIRINNPYMMFDEDIMRKVITNLISNALKFTERKGSVSVYATVLNENNSEKLYICVRDTGKGIPEEDIDRIFNRFYQADNQMSVSVSGQSGTGIGLYLCKKLITLLGGTVSAVNNHVAGSSFRIILPIDRGSGTQGGDETDVEHDEDLSFSFEKNNRLNILIVEDNKDMRDYIRSILSEYYNVLEASNGEEALRVLRNSNVDFVISDLMMPVMDGMELTNRIRNDFSISHLPVLMLTAKTSDEARFEGYKVGVDSYLLKPFDENLLLARISGIIENRKRFQQKFSLTMDVNSLEIEEDSSDKKFLDRAMKVVKENYMNADFEVSDFIAEMAISKSLLNKKMQSLTGQSANQFMRNYRLNLARELILKNRLTHNMNISEIAYQVGFNDPKYFTRCFTKHFNITPSNLMEDKQVD